MIPENLESGKVTIEDLLRLKRAERPSPEFWGRFEQELRAKQLAAIVEKRPWWFALRVPQVARSLARFQLPVGAAAVLALSFVVVREYRPSGISIFEGADRGQQIIEGPALAPRPVILSSTPVVAERAPAVAVEALDTNAGMASAAVSSDHVTKVDEPVSVGPGGLMAMIPWAPQSTDTPAAETPVVLGELSSVHFMPATNAGREHDFQGRVEIEPVVMAVRMAAAEAASDAPRPVVAVVSPREVRRNRILSNLAVADASDTERARVVQVRDVLASALDDDRLYDNVRRVGMGGDRLTLKF